MRISDCSSDVCSSDLSGKNARQAISAVKAKLDELKASLPPGVEIVPTYDRSKLIDREIENLTSKLIEEFIVVAPVCAIFLRSEERSVGKGVSVSVELGGGRIIKKKKHTKS